MPTATRNNPVFPLADRHSARLSLAATTDAQECEDLLERAGEAPDPARRADLLASAVGLYRGELVAGCYDDWVLPEQRRWVERQVGALLAVIGSNSAGPRGRAVASSQSAGASPVARRQAGQTLGTRP